MFIGSEHPESFPSAGYGSVAPSPVTTAFDEPEWMLSTDSHANKTIHEEFYYEQVYC